MQPFLWFEMCTHIFALTTECRIFMPSFRILIHRCINILFSLAHSHPRSGLNSTVEHNHSKTFSLSVRNCASDALFVVIGSVNKAETKATVGYSLEVAVLIFCCRSVIFLRDQYPRQQIFYVHRLKRDAFHINAFCRWRSLFPSQNARKSNIRINLSSAYSSVVVLMHIFQVNLHEREDVHCTIIPDLKDLVSKWRYHGKTRESMSNSITSIPISLCKSNLWIEQFKFFDSSRVGSLLSSWRQMSFCSFLYINIIRLNVWNFLHTSFKCV